MSDTWKKYLHSIRREEIDIAFSSFREKEFQNGLELGAGEGYQSTMLINYCNKLICTELNDYSTRLQENYFRNRKTDQEKIMRELKFSERMSDNDNRSWEPIVEKANKDNQELKKVMLSRYKQ